MLGADPAGAGWVQRGADMEGSAPNERLGEVVSMSSDGTVVAAAAPGVVRVWELNGATWLQRGGDISQGGSIMALALSGDGTTLAVGNPYVVSAGRVTLFKWDGSAWITQQSIDGETANDRSGWSVALSRDGTALAIGSVYNNNQSGHVRMYRWNGSAWLKRGADIDGAYQEQFGSVLSLSHDGLVLAAAEGPGDGASVEVYHWSGSSWSYRDQITSGLGGGSVRYSLSLSEDGSVLAVGDPGFSTQRSRDGRAVIYTWNGSGYSNTAGIFVGAYSQDQLGTSVSLSADGNQVIVGDRGNETVRVYRCCKQSIDWEQIGDRVMGRPVGFQVDGGFVSASADASIFAVGEPLVDAESGLVRIYESDGIPGRPTSVSATAAAQSAVVTWDSPFDTGANPIHSYVVAAHDGTTCTWVSGPLTCEVTGLTNGRAYTFTVTATNSSGTSPQSVASTPVTPRTVPGAPGEPSATPGIRSAIVAWTSPANDGGDAVSAYRVTASPGGRSCTWGTGPSECVIDGLTNGTEYTFSVTAMNSAGWGMSATTTAVPGHLLTISSVSGQGTVSGAGDLVSCPPACLANAPDLLAITATPAPGWEFSSWGGACSGSSTTCTLTMNQAREVSATFVEAPDNGGGPPGGSDLTSTPINVPTPSGVRWSVQDLWIVAEFTSSSSSGYSITATSGSATRTGSCSQSGSWVTCRVQVTPGTWVGSITPAGSAASALTSRTLAATKVARIARPRWSKPTTRKPLAIRFKAAKKTTYSVSATLKGKKSRTLRGKCRVRKGSVACSIRLKLKGRWVVSVTPKSRGSFGKPSRKTIQVSSRR